MKILDLRVKTPDELTGLLADLRKEQFNLRFQKASGQLENTARMTLVRRDIAQVLTILAELRQGRIIPKRKIVAGKSSTKAPIVTKKSSLLEDQSAVDVKSVKATKTKSSPKKMTKSMGKTQSKAKKK